jgi:hypothetical protein
MELPLTNNNVAVQSKLASMGKETVRLNTHTHTHTHTNLASMNQEKVCMHTHSRP